MKSALPSSFAAIDFETANSFRNSACSLAVVRVEAGEIVARAESLIRPPQNYFQFTSLHGISWKDVATAPTFDEVWDGMSELIQGVEFLVAHNSGFDKSVLKKCALHYGLNLPEYKFKCTVQIARRVWGFKPARLDCVCRELNIPLQHHNALSDAEACAKIMIAADAKLKSV